MAFLSEAAVEVALLEQLRGLGYSVEQEENIGPDGQRLAGFRSVTRTRAAAPAAPVEPVAPVAPVEPVAPCGPVAPVGPMIVAMKARNAVA